MTMVRQSHLCGMQHIGSKSNGMDFHIQSVSRRKIIKKNRTGGFPSVANVMRLPASTRIHGPIIGKNNICFACSQKAKQRV